MTHFVTVAPCEEWPKGRCPETLHLQDRASALPPAGRIGARTWRSLWRAGAEPQVMKPEELTADDLDTLAKLQRTVFEPQIRELTHRLGSRAAEKIIAYAQRNAHICSARGWAGFASQSGECYESCGRPAAADSSRCALCGPAARDRAGTRARQNEDHNAP